MAVPFSRLADIIEVSKKEMDDLGLFASILGHIGEYVFRYFFCRCPRHDQPPILRVTHGVPPPLPNWPY